MGESISEAQLEKQRGKARKLTWIVYGLTILSFPLYVWIFYNFTEDEGVGFWYRAAENFGGAAVLSLATLGGLWFLIGRRAYERFSAIFKTKYVMRILERVPGFEKLSYDPKNGFTWDEIRDTAVIHTGDKKYYQREDLLTGTYRGVPFKFSDVNTRKVVRYGKRTKIENIFAGQVICFFGFDQNKTSNGRLQVFRKEFLSDFSGWKAEHRIQTEDETFNSRFEIYAEDEHNAFYILTPWRMEMIRKFSDAAGTQISIVFQGEKMYVAAARQSMFDPVVDEPVVKQTARIYEDIKIFQLAGDILAKTQAGG